MIATFKELTSNFPRVHCVLVNRFAGAQTPLWKGATILDRHPLEGIFAFMIAKFTNALAFWFVAVDAQSKGVALGGRQVGARFIFTPPRPNYARPSPSIMPGQTWRDNGHKALMPVINTRVVA